MPAASRVTRGALAAAEDFASLSSRDRLIFAQAVYEYGARQAAWAEIAKLLSKHPLITRPKNFFTAQSCVTIYNYLMKDAAIERSDLCEAKKSPVNAQLAQRYYRDRVAELRDEIAAEEDRFKNVVTEIEDIRAGKWDDRIKAKMNGADMSIKMQASTPGKPVEFDEVMPAKQHTPVQGEEQTVDESRSRTESSVDRLPGPNDEIAMDVSSPVQHSPLPETSPVGQAAPETPKEEETAEQPVTEPASESPISEAQSQESVQVPKTRSQTRKEPPEATKTPSAEATEEDEAESAEVQDEQEDMPKEEVDEAVETQRDTSEEATPAATEVQEGEPVDAVSRESTPVPQDSPRDKKEGKRRASDADAIDSLRDKKRPREESEPVDTADSPATPSTLPSGIKNSKERKRFQSIIMMLHAQITAHRNGTIFHQPIKPSEAPDYYDIVKRPMDLKTIKNRVRDGRITTSTEYQRDIYLMFANSLMYNRPNSDIYMMAEEMMLDSEAEIQNFQQTEAYNLRTRG
ncbi:uncharacterized protein FOMMEDRAFT_147985 [Fomitiporia mediterranea MF3/22]|uniref:uncharacterized protein n=1 Tax=Fomitiporia mediterranea (strain MF3/22) TaxID=694068 RepID=UPI00044077BA|nr:uncharacterized protein FOMMEDRAFT_147985 [Fomitiporia mediterranea MF3/22]EJD01486.1 hypothetical protein FOMMEDRAFT_147985 [Fomitiporia mediterranea MF3/22]